MVSRRQPSGDPTKAETRRVVPAVQQAARVLFCLSRHAGSALTLTEICERVGIHKSKGYSILGTLMDFALVLKDPTSKSYSLGPGVLSLSRAVLDSTDIRQVSAPFLRDLVEATQSTALLCLIAQSRVFVMAREEAASGVGVTIRIGHSWPLTLGAHGRAIAAFLPEAEREALFAMDGQNPAEPRGAGLDAASLRSELESVRRLGYARDPGRVHQGVHAVSAPIFGASDVPIGCVIVMGTFPAATADRYGKLVAQKAQEISALLGRSFERIHQHGPLSAPLPGQPPRTGTPRRQAERDSAM